MSTYALSAKRVFRLFHTSSIESILLVGFGILVAILAVDALIQLPYEVSRDYNEGWNAYQALHAYSDQPLYPAADAFTANNYPPLSYYIVGLLGVVLNDHLISGRIIAFISFAVTAVMIFHVVRRFNSNMKWAIFSGLLFAGYVAAEHHWYLGINDPQWLAHAVQLTGLVVFLKSNRRDTLFYLASFLLVSSGFIKHNLLPLPFAVSLWLLVTDPRAFMRWIFMSMVIAALYFVVFTLSFGNEFLSNIFQSPRTYAFDEVVGKMTEWILPMAALIGAGLIGAALRVQVPGLRLLYLYGLLSLFWGAFTSGGAEVDCNCIFDAIIALCMIAGITMGYLHSNRLLHPFWGSRSAVITMACLLILPCVIALPQRVRITAETLQTIEEDNDGVAEQIRLIGSAQGSVMCEDLAMCYWAGKAFEVDMFISGQKISTGVVGEEFLTDQIEATAYRMIQLEERDGQSFRLPQNVNNVIAQNYIPFQYRPRGGLLFVPKSKSQ